LRQPDTGRRLVGWDEILQGGHILGAQGQIWTEYITDPRHVEYMALPRMCALAEVVWTAPEKKDYADFHRRLKTHLRRLDVLDVNYRRLDSAPKQE
jgi:hexosaminidase